MRRYRFRPARLGLSIALAVFLTVAVAGCESGDKVKKDNQGGDTLTEATDLVRSATDCDAAAAERIAGVFHKLGMGEITAVAVEKPQGTGEWLRVDAENGTYYAFVTEEAFLETVRAGSLDGRVLHQVKY